MVPALSETRCFNPACHHCFFIVLAQHLGPLVGVVAVCGRSTSPPPALELLAHPEAILHFTLFLEEDGGDLIIDSMDGLPG